jgi:DNA ligase-1
MREFALLLDALSNTPSRNGKLTLLRNYFRASPDPDRGFALAALTDEMPVTIPLRRVLTELSASRFDPVLFKFSRDYVGDTRQRRFHFCGPIRGGKARRFPWVKLLT